MRGRAGCVRSSPSRRHPLASTKANAQMSSQDAQHPAENQLLVRPDGLSMTPSAAESVGPPSAPQSARCESFLEGTAVMAGTSFLLNPPIVPPGPTDLNHRGRHLLLARDPCIDEWPKPCTPRRNTVRHGEASRLSAKRSQTADDMPVPVPILIELALIEPLRAHCIAGQRECAAMFHDALRLPAALDMLRDTWLRVDSAAPLARFREEVKARGWEAAFAVSAPERAFATAFRSAHARVAL